MRKLVLGYLGLESNKLDGQTVKTRNILELMQRMGDVDYFDTESFNLNLLSVFTMIKKIFLADIILYLPAQRNLKYIFPFIYLISKLTGKKIHYYVVGGWLSEFVQRKPIHCAMLKRIDRIFSETTHLKQVLVKEFKFENIDVFPNIRLFNPLMNKRKETNGLRLVFMSRIIRNKGLEVIESLCKHIYDNRVKDISISFYGPIGLEDQHYFEKRICKYLFVEYKGVLEPADIISTLSNYDVLILPTRFYTEGLPGAIIDAYQAGLPVIVTNWKYAREFVINNKTGFIIPFNKPNEFFISAVFKFLADKSLARKMEKDILKESYKYSLDSALEKISIIYK